MSTDTHVQQLVERLKGREVLVETWRTRGNHHALTIGDQFTGHRLCGPDVTGATLTHAFTVGAVELLEQLLAHAYDPNDLGKED